MAKDGRWTGGTTPLGYVSEKVEYVAGSKNRYYYRLAVDKAEAAVVQLIFSKYLEEHSIKAVEVYLVNNGLYTRKAYIKAKNLTLKQLAVKCGVSYASAKYWANKRNSPSKELYESYFKEFFLNEYK